MLNLYGSVYTKDIAYLVNYITYTAKNYLRIWFCLIICRMVYSEGAFQTGTWLCIWYHCCDAFFIFIFFFSFFSSFGRWKKKTKAKAEVDGSAAGKTIYMKGEVLALWERIFICIRGYMEFSYRFGVIARTLAPINAKANQEDQNSNIALLKKHSYKIGHLLQQLLIRWFLSQFCIILNWSSCLLGIKLFCLSRHISNVGVMIYYFFIINLFIFMCR